MTAHVSAGGHRYGFIAHYNQFNMGDAKQWRTLSAVTITHEDTGWYTKSEITLPPGKGLSDKQGVDIHTDNITWTGDAKEMKLLAKVPEGSIDVTFSPRGNVLYTMGTGYFPVFGDAKYSNYEYALPTMDTSGTLTLNGHTDKVRGQSWLDRQWGPLPDITKAGARWPAWERSKVKAPGVLRTPVHTRCRSRRSTTPGRRRRARGQVRAMNVTIDRTTPRERAPSPSVRLSLTPARTVPGRLSGAWWPRSRNLFRELPALVDALVGPRGQATRVTVNPVRWPVIPRRVPVSGHIVHVCWFTDEQHPHTLILLSHTVGRWELLVIPPETRGAAAERLMSAAAIVGNLRTAGRLMADEEATGDVSKARSREEAGETDGGASAPPPRLRPLDATDSLPRGRGR